MADKSLQHRRIDIPGLLEGRATTLEGVMPASAFVELTKDIDLQEDVRIQLKVHKSRQVQIQVRGTIHAHLPLECSRCLTDFVLPVNLEVDRRFVAGEDPANQVGEFCMEDDVTFLPDGMFSPLRMVEEELILELPMIPVCSEACRGLCTVCGHKRDGCACS
jgi:uncharacterized protein